VRTTTGCKKKREAAAVVTAFSLFQLGSSRKVVDEKESDAIMDAIRTRAAEGDRQTTQKLTKKNRSHAMSHAARRHSDRDSESKSKRR
jgi:hypothetical protein